MQKFTTFLQGRNIIIEDSLTHFVHNICVTEAQEDKNKYMDE